MNHSAAELLTSSGSSGASLRRDWKNLMFKWMLTKTERKLASFTDLYCHSGKQPVNFALLRLHVVDAAVLLDLVQRANFGQFGQNWSEIRTALILQICTYNRSHECRSNIKGISIDSAALTGLSKHHRAQHVSSATAIECIFRQNRGEVIGTDNSILNYDHDKKLILFLPRAYIGLVVYTGCREYKLRSFGLHSSTNDNVCSAKIVQ